MAVGASGGSAHTEARPGLGPADCNAAVGRLPAGFLLDGVERRDAFQRLGRDRRALGGMDIEELPSHMRQAGDLADRAGAGELAEPSVAVGMHPAAEARQMRLRMFGLAVGREAVPRRRRRLPFQGRSSRT